MLQCLVEWAGIADGENIGRGLAPRPGDPAGLRWTRPVGQFGGVAKLGSGCHQAANLSVAMTPYASSGVRPPSVEWGRRAL